MFITAIKIIASLALVWLLGYLLLTVLLRQVANLAWRIALAYPVGMAIIVWQLFFWLLVGRQTYGGWFNYLLLAEAAVLAVIIWQGRQKTAVAKPRPSKTKWPWSELLIVFLILVTVGSVVINALSMPTVNYDSLAMWSLKARMVWQDRHLDFDAASPHYWLNISKPNYPWLVPLMQSWLSWNSGRFNESDNNLLFAGFYISLLGLLYAAMRQELNRRRALGLTLILATMPFVYYHAYNAYADLTLAFYISAGLIFYYQWLKTKTAANFYASAVALGLAWLVKSDAVIYIVAMLGVTLVYLIIKKYQPNQLFYYLGAIAAAALPWLIFIVINHLSISNTSGGWGFYPQIWASVFNATFIFNSWNIWWYILIACLIAFVEKIRKNQPTLMICLAWLSCLAGLLALYLFTAEQQYAVDHTALSRTMISLVPVSVFLVALLLKPDVEA